jgi:hypothetical protein
LEEKMTGILQRFEDIVVDYLERTTDLSIVFTRDELKKCIRVQGPLYYYSLDVFFWCSTNEKKSILQQAMHQLCFNHSILWRVTMVSDWMMSIDMHEDDFKALTLDSLVPEGQK